MEPPKKQAPSRSATYQAHFESLSALRDFVAEGAQECGLSDAAIYQVQMAVDEAFTNIIEHAFGGECREKIKCTYFINTDNLTILLRDCGKPFIPEDIPDPDLKADLQHRQTGGLGLYFIRQLMDEVQFTFKNDPSNQDGCNILKMVKHKEQ